MVYKVYWLAVSVPCVLHLRGDRGGIQTTLTGCHLTEATTAVSTWWMKLNN